MDMVIGVCLPYLSTKQPQSLQQVRIFDAQRQSLKQILSELFQFVFLCTMRRQYITHKSKFEFTGALTDGLNWHHANKFVLTGILNFGTAINTTCIFRQLYLP